MAKKPAKRKKPVSLTPQVIEALRRALTTPKPPNPRAKSAK